MKGLISLIKLVMSIGVLKLENGWRVEDWTIKLSSIIVLPFNHAIQSPSGSRFIVPVSCHFSSATLTPASTPIIYFNLLTHSHYLSMFTNCELSGRANFINVIFLKLQCGSLLCTKQPKEHREREREK
jgi:hypothetical protein